MANLAPTRSGVRRLRACVVLLGTALGAAPLLAMDLQQAYDAALAQDPTLRAVRAATQAREERLPQARAQLRPNVSLSAARTRNLLESTSPNFFGEPVTTQSNYPSANTALTIRQPLYRKYQMADLEQAHYQVQDAQAALARETHNLPVRLAGAYFEALQAHQQLELVEAQGKATASTLDAARKRFAGGAGTRTDVDEAQAALDMNRAQALEARQAIDFTRRQLQTLVGEPVTALASLQPERMLLAAPEPADLQYWVDQALAHSAELQSLQAQLDAARLDVDKANAGHHPTLDAVAQWSRSESESTSAIQTSNTNRSLSVQLNIPLYTGGYTQSTVRQALAEQERAAQALEAQRRDLEIRVYREYRNVSEGVAKVRALEQALRSAQQVVLSNQRSFEAGSRTLLDALNAEQQLASVRRDLHQARLVYLLSRVRLHALTGAEPAAVIAQINPWLAH